MMLGSRRNFHCILRKKIRHKGTEPNPNTKNNSTVKPQPTVCKDASPLAAVTTPSDPVLLESSSSSPRAEVVKVA